MKPQKFSKTCRLATNRKPKERETAKCYQHRHEKVAAGTFNCFKFCYTISVAGRRFSR